LSLVIRVPAGVMTSRRSDLTKTMLIPDPHDYQRIARNRLLSLHKGRTASSQKGISLLSMLKKRKNC